MRRQHRNNLTPSKYGPIMDGVEEHIGNRFLSDDEIEDMENVHSLINITDHQFNPEGLPGTSRQLDDEMLTGEPWQRDFAAYQEEGRTYTNLETRNITSDNESDENHDQSANDRHNYSETDDTHDQSSNELENDDLVEQSAQPAQEENEEQDRPNAYNSHNPTNTLPKRKKKNYIPKKVKDAYKEKWNWTKEKPESFTEERFPFTEGYRVGPTKVYSQDPTELEVFESFQQGAVTNFIVEETNRVLRAKKEKITRKGKGRYKGVKDMSVEELNLVFAISILQGIVKFPRITDFWSNDILYRYEFVRSIMCRDRFLQIYGSLHFTELADAYTANDRLYKIRHLSDMYKKIFQENYYPGQELSVDESLECWQGRRLIFRVVIPNKVHVEGIEMFIICEAKTAYAMDFEYYAANIVEEYEKVIIDGTDLRYFTVWSKIVLHLAKPYLGKGHTLGLDNLYSDPRLFEVLVKNKTDAVGTFRTNRMCLPKGISDLELKKGETRIWYMDLPEEKAISALCWMDKKKVCMLSTFHDDTMLRVADKEGGPQAHKLKPKSCVEYRSAMRGVDLNDQIRSSYTIARPRTKRYYRKMFWNLFDIAILNSFVVYNKLMPPTKQKTFLHFKQNLIKQLVCKNKILHANSQRMPPTISSDHPQRLMDGKHHPRYTGNVRNTDGTVGRKARRQCVVCNHQTEKSDEMKKRKAKKKVDTECKICLAALCIGICWDVYHEMEDYTDYQRQVNVSHTILS